MWYMRTSAFRTSSVAGMSFGLYGMVVDSSCVGLRSQCPATAGSSGRLHVPRFSRVLAPGYTARSAIRPFTTRARKSHVPSFTPRSSAYQKLSPSRFQSVTGLPPYSTVAAVRKPPGAHAPFNRLRV